MRALLPFLKPYRWRVLLAFLLLCLASGSLLAVPAGFRQVIDLGFLRGEGGHASASTARVYFLALFGLGVVWGVAVAARYYVVNWLGERVTADLRGAVYARVLQQPPQFFETLQTGEVLSRLTGDATLVQTVVGSSVSMGLRSLFQAAGGMAMLAVTDLRLFGITLGLLGGVILPLIVLARRVRRLSRESQDRVADASAIAGEILNAAATVQAYTHEAIESRRYAESVENAFRSAMKRARLRSMLTALLIAAVFGAILFVLWLGARAVAGGGMSSGQLTSFVLYAVIVAGASGTLAEVWGDVMRAAGATERLMELLHTASPIVTPPVPEPLPAPGRARVGFEGVSFHYPSRPHTPALENFTLEIAAGETVALVGPSGAGKTTVFQLVQRFYDAGEGAVRFNGVDVRSLALKDLRGAIAVVPQDPVIFSADALDNIRYGRPDASDEEVLAAARAALADEFIARLPEGYRTFLGERGVRLSGGQRQRIAIARAILKNAPLLLLDEATSALDAESERWVQQGLEAAMRGRTTLVIAHRLATVQRVDRIVVMEQGRIVEQGTAAELLRSGGLYARLAELQLAV
ncbi:ATP-binding cassette domain-containing protein [Methylococcus sp. EFPC2]|nr:ATP-binding cassette domain-containing protein [Methylococcus sp. EFPC2]